MLTAHEKSAIALAYSAYHYHKLPRDSSVKVTNLRYTVKIEGSEIPAFYFEITELSRKVIGLTLRQGGGYRSYGKIYQRDHNFEFKTEEREREEIRLTDFDREKGAEMVVVSSGLTYTLEYVGYDRVKMTNRSTNSTRTFIIQSN